MSRIPTLSEVLVMRSSRACVLGLAAGLLLIGASCATEPPATDITAKRPNADDLCEGRTVLGSHIKKKSCAGEAGTEGRALNSWELQRSEQTQVRPDN